MVNLLENVHKARIELEINPSTTFKGTSISLPHQILEIYAYQERPSFRHTVLVVTEIEEIGKADSRNLGHAKRLCLLLSNRENRQDS